MFRFGYGSNWMLRGASEETSRGSLICSPDGRRMRPPVAGRVSILSQERNLLSTGNIHVLIGRPWGNVKWSLACPGFPGHPSDDYGFDRFTAALLQSNKGKKRAPESPLIQRSPSPPASKPPSAPSACRMANEGDAVRASQEHAGRLRVEIEGSSVR